MKKIKEFIIGLLVGIANIAPGVSGALFLLSFGVYEEILDAINNMRKNFVKTIIYFIPIGSGVVIGTLLFSKVLEFALEKWPLYITCCFLGLIIGTIPDIYKNEISKNFNKRNIIFLFITLAIGLLLLTVQNDNIVTIDTLDFGSLVLLISTGTILVGSMIIPGVSGTAIMMLIGVYDIYLNALSNLNFTLLIPIMIGMLIGAFAFVRLTSYLLKKFHDATIFAILGFVMGTIPTILRGSPSNALETTMCALIVIGSMYLSTYLGKIKKAS